MPKKRPRDLNKLAARLVAEATGTAPQEDVDEKDREMAARGRLGGLKGGKARAATLSAPKRSQIARKAAKARWAKKP